MQSNPQKREELTKAVHGFLQSPLAERLYEILEEQEAELDRPKETDYDSPSWAYKQADYNGARRMLQKIKGIIRE